MKISTKGRYALALMLDVAKGYKKDEYISINKISEEEHISLKYLEKIAASLKKNNLLKSTTGAQGGYKLVKDPSLYSIGEILRAVENIEIADCLNNTNCPKKTTCKTFPLWDGLNKELNKYLDSKSLKDLM